MANLGLMAATVTDWANALLLEASTADLVARPGRVVLGNPTVGWDGCCDGVVGVEMSGFGFAGTNWPNPGTQTVPPFRVDCADEYWRAEFRVVLLRCVPAFAEGPDGEQGRAPRPEVVNESAVNLQHDAFAVWSALRCSAKAGRLADTGRCVIGGVSPIAGSGTCAGHSIQVIARVHDCAECA